MNFIRALCLGRGPSWRDVLIDTVGVFMGILIILAIVSIYIALKGENGHENFNNNKYI